MSPRKSIYVSIALAGYDTELATTILSCVQNRSGENDIYIGVAFISNRYQYKKAIKNIPELPFLEGVKIKFFDIKKNFGISKGRNAALSMYSNQDFVLQVDAHMYFQNDWDKQLIQLYNDAIAETENEKTIVTAIPLEYVHSTMGNDELFLAPGKTGFPRWKQGIFIVEGLVPKWEHMEPHSISDRMRKISGSRAMLPAVKICGAFMFGSSAAVKDIHLPDGLMFWEEEVILTLELFRIGYSLVYPNKKINLYHMYEEWAIPEFGKRANPSDLDRMSKLAPAERSEAMKQNMIKYYKNNQHVVDSYEQWSGFSLTKGIYFKEFVDKSGNRTNHQINYSNAKQKY